MQPRGGGGGCTVPFAPPARPPLDRLCCTPVWVGQQAVQNPMSSILRYASQLFSNRFPHDDTPRNCKTPGGDHPHSEQGTASPCTSCQANPATNDSGAASEYIFKIYINIYVLTHQGSQQDVGRQGRLLASPRPGLKGGVAAAAVAAEWHVIAQYISLLTKPQFLCMGVLLERRASST